MKRKPDTHKVTKKDQPRPRVKIKPAKMLAYKEHALALLADGTAILRSLSCSWRPVSVPVPPELINDPNSVTGYTKMLLLAVPGCQTAVRGWYYGGLLNEFRMDGCPQLVHPTHWMPMPALPDHN